MMYNHIKSILSLYTSGEFGLERTCKSIDCLAELLPYKQFLYLLKIFDLSSSFGGSQYSQMATKATNPPTTLHKPAIHTQPPVMRQLLGHSSCAKCRTVTCRFSS